MSLRKALELETKIAATSPAGKGGKVRPPNSRGSSMSSSGAHLRRASYSRRQLPYRTQTIPRARRVGQPMLSSGASRPLLFPISIGEVRQTQANPHIDLLSNLSVLNSLHPLPYPPRLPHLPSTLRGRPPPQRTRLVRLPRHDCRRLTRMSPSRPSLAPTSCALSV